jgi:hypothetical protein
MTTQITKIENTKKMKTLKELRSFSGKSFTRTLIGGRSVEEIDLLREEIKEHLTKQGADLSLLCEDEKSFSYGASFMLKPKVKREQVGIVTFRSSGDYIFSYEGQKSYGNKIRKECLCENGFKVPTIGGHFIYTINSPSNA